MTEQIRGLSEEEIEEATAKLVETPEKEVKVIEVDDSEVTDPPYVAPTEEEVDGLLDQYEIKKTTDVRLVDKSEKGKLQNNLLEDLEDRSN